MVQAQHSEHVKFVCLVGGTHGVLEMTLLFVCNADDEPLSVTFGEAISSLADGVAGILALDVVPGVPLVVQPGVMAQVSHSTDDS